MGFCYLLPFTVLIFGSFAEYRVGPNNQNSKVAVGNEHFQFGDEKWVVLVAGSSGWYNYRHQADICHAYQIIRGNGIPAENIITMLVDDIAYNSRNPTPGKIINKPNGTNVYEGVVIDYKGEDVNSKNFLNIITGNKTAMQSIGTGKVVEGGPHDRIFINVVDHGATGILAFPNDFLYADQLNSALNSMYETSSYRKMLLYIEACKAGSMFDGILSENTNILAVTASGPRENSYGCYCRSQSGQYRTCLGDLFSVTWMEDLDKTVFESALKKQTVLNDYKKIRTQVTESNVMVYGDFETGYEKLSAFIGYLQSEDKQKPLTRQMANTSKRKIMVSNLDVHRNTIINQLSLNTDNYWTSPEERHKLTKDLLENNKMRYIIDRTFRTIYFGLLKLKPDIWKEIGDQFHPENLELTLDIFPCYRNILNQISDSCFSLSKNPYSLDKLTVFANICTIDKHIHHTVGKLIESSCWNIPKNITNVF